MGVPPKKIIFITSQHKVMNWEEYIGYKDIEKVMLLHIISVRNMCMKAN